LVGKKLAVQDRKEPVRLGCEGTGWTERRASERSLEDLSVSAHGEHPYVLLRSVDVQDDEVTLPIYFEGDKFVRQEFVHIRGLCLDDLSTEKDAVLQVEAFGTQETLSKL
jgi:hypothetical protein